MSRDRDIERILDRWFEEGPTEVADRVIAGALDAIDRTEQRPVLRRPRRYPSMPTSFKLAVAAVVLVVAGALAFAAVQPKAAPSVGTASPSPAASPVAGSSAPSASSTSSHSPSPATPASASIPAAAPTIGNVTAIAAGALFTCALTGGGGVKCWGSNVYGELGNGVTAITAGPVDRRPGDVLGLTRGVTAISSGGYHGCALIEAGGVKCWGWELGNGSTTTSFVPVDVSGLTSGVVAIDASMATCAVTTGGGVKCWGWNTFGQLGNGTKTNSSTPVDVSGLTSGVSAISAGGGHTCAITSAGGVKCWGYNNYGQLGNGSTTDSVKPVDVSGLTGGVIAIAAGDYHTCAMTSAGGVKCWGNNLNGQLGNGETTISAIPVDVTGLTSGVTAIAAGAIESATGSHTCALTDAGGVKCWGYNNAGQLGDGSVTDSSTPVDVKGLASGITALTVRGDHSCALTSAGGVMCWGGNENGQLGDGTTANSSIPVAVNGL